MKATVQRFEYTSELTGRPYRVSVLSELSLVELPPKLMRLPVRLLRSVSRL
jgi:hypothetical protein